MPTRFGIGQCPSSTRCFTPHVMSSCIFRPHSPLPALRNFLPYPGGAAEVRHQHRVPAIGEELRQRTVAPVIARPRTAVRNHQQRRSPWPATPFGSVRYAGISSPSDDLYFTTCIDGQRDSRCNFSEPPVLQHQRLRLAVVEVRLRGLRVGTSAHHPDTFVAPYATRTRFPSRAICPEPLIIALQRLVMK